MLFVVRAINFANGQRQDGVGFATIASPYLGLGAGIAAAVRSIQIQYAWLGAGFRICGSSPNACIAHSN